MTPSTQRPELALHTRRSRAVGRERICLTVTPQLLDFLAASGQAGLDVSLAVRLGLERALLLADSSELRMEVQRARRTLNRASIDPRATLPLGAAQASYIRRLYRDTPSTEQAPSGELRVELPESLLSRASMSLSGNALHAGAVDEMIAWERAARLQGRTMLEWGLKTLAAAVLMA